MGFSLRLIFLRQRDLNREPGTSGTCESILPREERGTGIRVLWELGRASRILSFTEVAVDRFPLVIRGALILWFHLVKKYSLEMIIASINRWDLKFLKPLMNAKLEPY